MNSKKLLAQWGLKWNPFSPELPGEGLLATPKIEHFAWRVEQLVQEGGFALITGESGTGKSVALRIVAGRLSSLRDVTVGVIERPQSKSPDFYRELGDIFAVKLTPHNRWGGFKALRERWKSHVASSRIRPVLLVDEAQEMSPDVLGELRILSSADFDAKSLLTVVLSGDARLPELLRHDDLVPLGTRIRARLVTEMALSVATGTPCLGKYAVSEPGPVLVYLAEDALLVVRERVEGMARHRGLDPGEEGSGLKEQVLDLLAQGKVLTRTRLRDALGVKNERLGDELESLERAGQICRTPSGWQRR